MESRDEKSEPQFIELDAKGQSFFNGFIKAAEQRNLILYLIRELCKLDQTDVLFLNDTNVILDFCKKENSADELKLWWNGGPSSKKPKILIDSAVVTQTQIVITFKRSLEELDQTSSLIPLFIKNLYTSSTRPLVCDIFTILRIADMWCKLGQTESLSFDKTRGMDKLLESDDFICSTKLFWDDYFAEMHHTIISNIAITERRITMSFQRFF